MLTVAAGDGDVKERMMKKGDDMHERAQEDYETRDGGVLDGPTTKAETFAAHRLNEHNKAKQRKTRLAPPRAKKEKR